MDINNYLLTAKNKLENKTIKTLILSIYAGIFIAIAGLLSTIVSLTIYNYSISKILSGIVFPIGLILVILFKTELFTGNSLLIIPLLEKKTTIKKVLKNWIIVYLGNLIGILIITFLVYNTPLKDKISESLINIANTKLSYTFIEAMILGILCNFLVTSAVYLSTLAKTITEKIIVIFIPIFTFIVLSLEHSIANMYYLSFGYLLDNTITIKEILLNNLLPVNLGNIIGGLFLGISLSYLKEKNKLEQKF